MSKIIWIFFRNQKASQSRWTRSRCGSVAIKSPFRSFIFRESIFFSIQTKSNKRNKPDSILQISRSPEPNSKFPPFPSDESMMEASGFGVEKLQRENGRAAGGIGHKPKLGPPFGAGDFRLRFPLLHVSRNWVLQLHGFLVIIFF